MKRSDTLFRHKQILLHETGASLRSMVNLITAKTNNSTIDFREYEELGVCERVGAWIMANDGESGVWGLFTEVTCQDGHINFLVEADYDYERNEEMYGYSLDELIYLHDEIQKIYKYVVKGKSAEEIAKEL